MSNRRTFVIQNGLFGLCIGISFIAVAYLFQHTGQVICMNAQLNNTLLLLSMLGAFIGTHKYREEHLGGLLTYSKALGICIFILGVASLLYSIYTFLLYISEPELQSTYLQMMLQILEELYQGVPHLDSMKTLMESLITPGFIAFSEFINKILTSFIFSLPLAFILRRRSNNTI